MCGEVAAATIIMLEERFTIVISVLTTQIRA